jgi:branched-chain amino acid transport system ATP-binding protein/urea transport system ATP-binding protein
MNFIRAISDIVTLFHQGEILMEDTMDIISADPKAREIYLGQKS